MALLLAGAGPFSVDNLLAMLWSKSLPNGQRRRAVAR